MSVINFILCIFIYRVSRSGECYWSKNFYRSRSFRLRLTSGTGSATITKKGATAIIMPTGTGTRDNVLESLFCFSYFFFLSPFCCFFVSSYTRPVRNVGPASLNYFNGLSAPHPVNAHDGGKFFFSIFFFFLVFSVSELRKTRA